MSVELPSSKGFFERLNEREFIEEMGRMPFGKSEIDSTKWGEDAH